VDTHRVANFVHGAEAIVATISQESSPPPINIPKANDSGKVVFLLGCDGLNSDLAGSSIFDVQHSQSPSFIDLRGARRDSLFALLIVV